MNRATQSRSAEDAPEQRFRRWGAAGCRLLIAAVFLFAAAGKIAAPAEFAQSIAAYQILTPLLIHPAAILVPWLEVVAAIALLTPTRLRPAGGLILLGLLVGFTAAIGWVIHRGIDTECGCFGDGWLMGPAGWPHIARNIVLLAILCVGLFTPGKGMHDARACALALKS